MSQNCQDYATPTINLGILLPVPAHPNPSLNPSPTQRTVSRRENSRKIIVPRKTVRIAEESDFFQHEVAKESKSSSVRKRYGCLQEFSGFFHESYKKNYMIKNLFDKSLVNVQDVKFRSQCFRDENRVKLMSTSEDGIVDVLGDKEITSAVSSTGQQSDVASLKQFSDSDMVKALNFIKSMNDSSSNIFSAKTFLKLVDTTPATPNSDSIRNQNSESALTIVSTSESEESDKTELNNILNFQSEDKNDFKTDLRNDKQKYTVNINVPSIKLSEVTVPNVLIDLTLPGADSFSKPPNYFEVIKFEKPDTPSRSEKVDVHICSFPNWCEKSQKKYQFKICNFRSRAGTNHLDTFHKKPTSEFDELKQSVKVDTRSKEFIHHQLSHLDGIVKDDFMKNSKNPENSELTQQFRDLPYRTGKLTMHICLVKDELTTRLCNYETDRSDNFKKHQVGKHYPKHLSKPITCPFFVKTKTNGEWKPCDYYAVRSDDCQKHIKPAHEMKSNDFQHSKRMNINEYIFHLRQNTGFSLDIADKIHAKWTAEYNAKTRTREDRIINRKWIELIDMGGRPDLPDLRKIDKNRSSAVKETKVNVLGGYEVDLRWFQNELEGWLRNWKPPRKNRILSELHRDIDKFRMVNKIKEQL